MSVFRFLGGPLAGTTRAKSAPGRWPRFLDDAGDFLSADVVAARERAGRVDFYTRYTPYVDDRGTCLGNQYLHRSLTRFI